MPLGSPAAAAQLFEAGAGFGSVQLVGTLYAGQITLTNGSVNILGIGTDFLNETEAGLSYWYDAYVVDSAGDVFQLNISTITDDTHATISGIYKGGGWHLGTLYPPEFDGVSGTYDFFLQIGTASGFQATSIGPNSVASDYYATVVGGYSAATASQATAVGLNANALAFNATAIGTNSLAANQDSTAVGYGAQAAANGATAIGTVHSNSVANSVTLGSGSVFVRATEKRFEVLGAAGDIVLASPDGTRWKITVSDLGVISAATA